MPKSLNLIMIKRLLAIAAVLIVCIAFYITLTEKPGKDQDPKPPFPYNTEDVTFENTHAGIKLAGTLTRPKAKGPVPVVILISGSGPQDRNEEVFGHKPFLVLADHLTRQGIAVLRYDDRGVAKSTGDFMAATTADFATDTDAAINYLKTRKEIDPLKMGIAGHSEGGLVAAITASRNPDVAFLIALASPGVYGMDVMRLQTKLIAQAGGVSEEGIAKLDKIHLATEQMLRNAPDTSTLRRKLTAYAKANFQDYPAQMLPPGMNTQQFINSNIDMLNSPGGQFLFKVEPADYFKKLTCPVLAINGSKDLQVDGNQNLPAIRNAVTSNGNSRVTTKQLPGLNHFFQECKTGHPLEYAGISQTFSPVALNVISDWLRTNVLNRPR